MYDLALVPGLNNTKGVFSGVVTALPPWVKVHAHDNPALDSIDDIARAWLKQLPERFWLAGFSFGGYVSLALLALAPERVQGIALICSSPTADSEAATLKRNTALQRVARGEYFEMVDAQASNAFHPDSLSNAALMAQRRQMVRDYGPECYAAHVRATSTRPDRTALLDGSCPTLIVSSAGDKVIPPSFVHDYAQRVPCAQIETVEGAGHLLPMERPAELARLLAAWIQRQS